MANLALNFMQPVLVSVNFILKIYKLLLSLLSLQHSAHTSQLQSAYGVRRVDHGTRSAVLYLLSARHSNVYCKQTTYSHVGILELIAQLYNNFTTVGYSGYGLGVLLLEILVLCFQLQDGIVSLCHLHMHIPIHSSLSTYSEQGKIYKITQALKQRFVVEPK
jgi:hypothetical protein